MQVKSGRGGEAGADPQDQEWAGQSQSRRALAGRVFSSSPEARKKKKQELTAVLQRIIKIQSKQHFKSTGNAV